MARTVALYHHLPPGGADRAMYELVRHTNQDFDYILFNVDLGARDTFDDAQRSPIEDVVSEVRTERARSGGGSRLGRWSVTVPSMLAAERRVAAAINADPSIEAVVAHHQRFLQAPSILSRVDVPSLYFVQEPRRRSFEYDLRHSPANPTLAAAVTAPLEAWAKRHDIRQTRSATRLLCNSDHSREYIWRAYGRNATVNRLGVDANRFALRPTCQVRDNEVVAVGSLDPTKGHDLAIAAVALLDPAIRPRMRIVHNRSDPATCEALVAQARAASVDLVLDNQVTEEELVALYQRAQAVLLTARVEPLGLTALEAMACGTPVVAVREGGYRETVIDDVNGVLTDRNPASLSAGIARILAGGFAAQDDTIRKSVTSRYSWPDATAAYRTVLEELLD